ncbi:LysR substrate-binding domain-containing protein [Mesorhizobium sp. B2-4-8]|uniref:LysR substrate-binding domain-containing protein n=1 Tax=Mesorhizobium sp. B2-4-8 TaxID=2589941 RepID=UPI00112631B8|nr:LysR substrate-binding domain-containing protein [Mesorhizobium sp. B2-4-8]TPL35528.1 LysR family transcriptional regulator [Mesorhizobium sp. B2-4-8]
MSVRQPTLESLRFLEAAVRHGNFTRAAAELGVTPAAVSLRMRDLEADLGTPMFHRSGPHLAPTAAGIELARRVAEALRLVRAAVDDCVETTEPLRVTSVPTFAMRWLVQRLPRYRALPGAVPIELDVSTGLRAGRDFDVAIRTGTGDWPELDATALFPVEATPMLSPSLAAKAPLSCPPELASLPLLPHDDWPRWFAEAGAPVGALTYCADDHFLHELQASAAAEGEGVALLPPTFFASLVKEGKLMQPFAKTIVGPKWHYVLLKAGERRSAVRRFRDWLKEEAQRENNNFVQA